MSGTEAATVAAILFAAVLVQSVTGFGLALLAVPVLALVLDVKTAVVAVSLVAVLATAAQARHERAHLDRPLALRLGGSAAAGFPLGLAALVSLPERPLRAALGAAVLAGTAALVAAGPRLRLPASADLAAGLVSGALATSVGTNGPPLVLLLRSRQLPPGAFRGTISAVFAWSGLVSVALFAAAGRVTGAVLAAAAAGLPGAVAGWVVGTRVKAHVAPGTFQTLAVVLLVVSGGSALASALIP